LLFNIQFLRAKCSMSFWFTSAIFLIKFHFWFVKIHFFGLQVQFSSLKFPFCGLNMIKLHSSVAPSCGGAFWLAVQTPFFLREVLQGGMVSQSFVEISIRYHYKMYMHAFSCKDTFSFSLRSISLSLSLSVSLSLSLSFFLYIFIIFRSAHSISHICSGIVSKLCPA
jgi:hypothetical protein